MDAWARGRPGTDAGRSGGLEPGAGADEAGEKEMREKPVRLGLPEPRSSGSSPVPSPRGHSGSSIPRHEKLQYRYVIRAPIKSPIRWSIRQTFPEPGPTLVLGMRSRGLETLEPGLCLLSAGPAVGGP